MDFIKYVDLRLRRLILQTYNVVAPLISKAKISKIQVAGRPLGHIIYPFFMRTLHYRIPEPIEVKGAVMYYRTGDGRGEQGWVHFFDYEIETYSMLKQIIRRGMTVVDVGAHIGYYTLLAAKCVGQEGKVYAFEADPSYHALLVKNIETNNLDEIVETFNQVVSNALGKTTLYLRKNMDSSIFKTIAITGKTSIMDSVSLDIFFKNQGWPPVQVIKIDIEGAEILALEGMEQLVKKNPCLKLVIELNPYCLSAAGKTPEDLLMMLSKLGFSQTRVLAGNKKPYRIPDDIPYLANLGRELCWVNLLCEQGE